MRVLLKKFYCQPLRFGMLSLRWTASLGKSGWWSSSLGLPRALYGCVVHTCARSLTLSEKKKHMIIPCHQVVMLILFYCKHGFKGDKYDKDDERNKTSKASDILSPPYLTSAVQFIGEFDFTKGDRSFHPVRSEVWRVRVNVHAAGSLRLRLSTGHPLSVHIFPPVVVRRYKVQQKRIHGVRVQSRHVHFQHRKHAPWWEGE